MYIFIMLESGKQFMMNVLISQSYFMPEIIK